MFGVELVDTCFMVNLVLCFIGGGLVDGIDDCVSEFVHHGHDLVDDTLIGEVLLGG